MRQGRGVHVVEALERLGGVAEAATLTRLTSRARLRAASERGDVVRDGTGHYALPGADASLRKARELSAVLCLDSAARHHGWKLKHVPATPAVAVPRQRKVTAARRHGVRLVYADLEAHEVDGPATTPLRTVLDCAARLGFDEALAVADSALRSGAGTSRELRLAAEQVPTRYRRRCLRVAEHATPLADNPFESVLRALALDVPGLRVEPQVTVPGIGRPDLLDRRLRLVVEADSFEFHGRRQQLTRDCRRYNAFVTQGWRVVRFSWEQVMFEPDYVTEVLTLLVRPPRPADARSGSHAA
ncbi:DUF559 domain-containing protein [soil metagenome]